MPCQKSDMSTDVCASEHLRSIIVHLQQNRKKFRQTIYNLMCIFFSCNYLFFFICHHYYYYFWCWFNPPFFSPPSLLILFVQWVFFCCCLFVFPSFSLWHPITRWKYSIHAHTHCTYVLSFCLMYSFLLSTKLT